MIAISKLFSITFMLIFQNSLLQCQNEMTIYGHREGSEPMKFRTSDFEIGLLQLSRKKQLKSASCWTVYTKTKKQ